MTDNDLFESVTLASLRERTSEKWAGYPPDVLPAWVAEMDFPLATPIRSALERALAVGDCGYADAQPLRPVFRSFVGERFGWSIEDHQVFAVPDVMAGVSQAIHLLTAPGDGIVVNPPVYPPFFEVIRHAGRQIVEVPLRVDDSQHWSIDFAALESAFANGAKAYLLCSPHNPVGRVWTAGELNQIATLAERYHVAVIADEIHGPLTVPGIAFVPFLSVAPAKLRAVAMLSASKAWNVPGLKCGVLVAGPAVRNDVRARLMSIPTEIASRIGNLGVIASIAAFRDSGTWLDELRSHLDRNGKLLAQLLAEYIPQARYTPPPATYLAWIDCTGLAIEGEASKHFLQHGRVALYRGSAFGKEYAKYVRLNMGTSRAILTQIVQRMASAL
jgi:cysteine-S-conjugate beta-lyase